jgi:hypothetical protein
LQADLVEFWESHLACPKTAFVAEALHQEEAKGLGSTMCETILVAVHDWKKKSWVGLLEVSRDTAAAGR